MKFVTAAIVIFSLLADAGCGQAKNQISSIQRKEAANLAAEAQFAVTLRNFSRAEGLLVKAAGICPDTGDYWMGLGSTQMRLGKRPDAKTAYKKALKAYEDEAAAEKADSRPVLQQISVLALLGRVDEARTLSKKLPGRFPADSSAREFVQEKQLDAMLADSKFREVAF